MKRIFNLIIIALIISSFTFASDLKLPVAQGNTNSELGIYTIEKAAQFEMIKVSPCGHSGYGMKIHMIHLQWLLTTA